MSQFKTKAFKALNKKWHDKLKKSGFEDIEEYDSPNEMLKRWHGYDFKRVKDLEARTTYYQNASWFLEHHCFDTSLEKRIWACHAQGMAYRETARVLKIKENQIYRILAKIKKEFNGND